MATTTMTYKLYEDNSGGLHLAVLDASETCIYYLTDADHALVLDTLANIKDSGDPIAYCWESGEDNPQECYRQINNFVNRHNGSAWEVEV